MPANTVKAAPAGKDPGDTCRYGIDLGGTKIEAIVLDPQGRQLARQRQPTPRGDYRATVEAIAGLTLGLQQTFGPGPLGIGIPGTIGGAGTPSAGVVKNANSTWLTGHPLADDLARRLGQPVRVANDADCMALSEATDGAAAGASVAFGVILGTGVGGGVVVNGSILSGPNGIAGEWGHNPLPWPDDSEHPGPSCYCGKQGCIETFLSGPALAADHRRHMPAAQSGPAGRDAETLTAIDIAAAASKGNPLALASLHRYAGRLARSLAAVINLLDPDVIVLAGGGSNISLLYELVPSLWGQWVFSDCVLTRLVPALHGDSSGVRGAAWLWENPGSLHKTESQPGDV